jgi:hypothetical protein
MHPRAKTLRAIFLGAGLGVGLAMTATAPYSGFAQGITTGGLFGQVIDPTGAVLPGASIVIVNDATGARSDQQSRADGGFSLLNLPIGHYTITFSHPGFADVVMKNVEVNVGSRNFGSVSLKPSGEATTVEVTATNPLVDTTTGEVSQTFSTVQLSSLPLNNGFDAVTLLQPGVVQTHDNNFSNNNGATFSSNGQRGRSNNFQLDGQNNNDNSVAGPQVFFGNQDALAGVQVITNNFSAQYGRNMGTVVNYLTKTGTNDIHGSVFEFYEGNWGSAFLQGQKSPVFGFCAAGTTDTTNCIAPTLPRFTDNAFGGTVGFPIMKDKLWGFGSAYFNRNHQGEGVYSSGSGNALFLTPDSLKRLQAADPTNGAIVSLAKNGPYGISIGNPQPGPIVAADSGTLTVSSGQDIPVDYAPVIRRVAGVNNDEELLGRVDWQPTGKDHIFIRYMYQDNPNTGAYGDSTVTDLAGGRWNDVPATTHSVGGDITHTFSPSWVNQLRYSFQESKVLFQSGSVPGCTVNSPESCYSPVSISGTLNDGASVLGYGYTVSSLPQGRTVKNTQVQDNATWTHGHHNVSFGGEWSFQNSPNPFLPNFYGSFNYGSLQSLVDQNGTLNLADGNFTLHFTEPDAAAYIQDDWKVSSNITLNLGLRWEFFGQAVQILHGETMKREANAATAFWDTSLPLSERTFPDVPDHYKNYQPRIGFAYNPVEVSRRLVVRGGFAINFDPAFYNMFLNSGTASPVINLGTISCTTDAPCIPSTGTTGADVRALNLPLIPRGANPNSRNQTLVSKNFGNPYAESYSLSIEWGPNDNVVFGIRYAGNHTAKQFQSLNANPRLRQTALTYPDVLPPSLFCSDKTQIGYRRLDCNKTRVRERANTAFSNYNGLQLTATSRQFHGLSGTIAYTYSRTIDNTSDVFGTFGGGNTVTFAENPFNTNTAERGVSGNSIPHVASASFVYDAPTPKGHGRLVETLLGGYQLNGVWTFDTGQPVTPYFADYGQLLGGSGPFAFPGLSNYCDGNFASSFNAFISTCRPVLSNRDTPIAATGIYLNSDSGAFYGIPAGYYTLPSFFDYLFGSPTAPTATSRDAVHWLWNNTDIADLMGTPFPGVGRNTLRANRWNNLDASIFKNTKIRERYDVQLQFSAYNVLNHRLLGTNDPELDDTTTFWDPNYNYGHKSRQVQIGARILF